ncbi:MAG: hypothetical protein M5U26_11455 [Planctomycetota bacterium]|nr:hypothetical protein [Planctomycetota bacterium]
MVNVFDHSMRACFSVFQQGRAFVLGGVVRSALARACGALQRRIGHFSNVCAGYVSYVRKHGLRRFHRLCQSVTAPSLAGGAETKLTLLHHQRKAPEKRQLGRLSDLHDCSRSHAERLSLAGHAAQSPGLPAFSPS